MSVNFSEGDFVWHKKMGVGRIGLSTESEILVEFDGGKEEIYELGQKKKLPFYALSADGFMLRKRDDKEAFAKQIKDAPIEAINAFLNDSVNEITPEEIKNVAVPDLIPAEEWNAWVKSLIQAVKNDARFEVEKNDKIVFKGDVGDIAGDILARFKQALSIKEKQRIVKEMLQLEQKGVPVEDMREAAISFFTGTTMSKTNKMGARLEALIFLKELDPYQFEMLKDQLYGEIRDLTDESAAEAVSEVQDANIRKELLDIIKDIRPTDFIDITSMLTKRFKKLQRDWTLDTLLGYEDKTYIKTMIENTMADIATNKQPFVWMFKKLLDNREALESVGPGAAEVIRSMFKILNNMHMTSVFSKRSEEISITKEEDELVKLLRDNKKMFLFLSKQTKMITEIFVSQYFECTALEIEKREEFVKKAMEKFPGIQIIEDRHREEEEAIQLTRETYEQFKQEYKEIIENKLIEATNDVKTAREWGDVSDNAELRVAQERQRALMSRKTELERIFESCTVMQ